ncbi:MAG: N-acetylmuramoyl-L-alanine amidase [Bacteroidota bacterium]
MFLSLRLQLLLLLSLAGVSAYGQALVAQEPLSSDPWTRAYTLQGAAKKAILNLPQEWEFTAVAVRIPKGASFAGMYLTDGIERLDLEVDPHGEEEAGQLSNLESLSNPSDGYQIYLPGGFEGPVEIILINSGVTPKIQRPTSRGQDESYCEFPPAIPQSEWRSGLPSPSPGRSFSTVGNLIVHHSAGSNTNTNFTQVVRDIYVFHTRTRGWSDIGYNYLISQNGDLYLGRDPEGGDQDRVIGAHFCGGNTGTMGVCLLGDYTNFTPPDTMLGTLERLLSWKAFKDELDPEATNSHRLNSNLGVIAGHRDGCATECPGQHTYDRLEEMRGRVAQRLGVCSGEIPIEEPPVPPADSISVYRLTPTYRPLRVYAADPTLVDTEELYLIDLQGRIIPITAAPWTENVWELQVPSAVAPGFYVLHLVVNQETRRQRVRIF